MHLSLHIDHWVGLLAGVLTTSAFVPQVFQILKSRETENLSLTMYAMSAAGVSIWIYYGFQIHAPSIIIFNALNLVLISMILVAKLYWK